MTERTIKLRLRNSKGEYEEFFQDFVPQSKRLEYIRKERELEAKAQKEGFEPTQDQYEEMQVEFVASLFNDKKVTAKTILDGLDTADKGQIFDIVRYRVLGYSKAEDELLKKAMMAELSAGENSTN